MTRTTPTDVALRRAKTLELRLAGGSERFIAERLGVSQSTTHRDLQELDEQFRAEAQQDLRAAKGKAVLRYEAIIRRHWGGMGADNPKAAAVVLQAMAGIERVLGLHAPTQLTIEDLRQRAPVVAEFMGVDAVQLAEAADRWLRNQQRR